MTTLAAHNRRIIAPTLALARHVDEWLRRWSARYLTRELAMLGSSFAKVKRPLTQADLDEARRRREAAQQALEEQRRKTDRAQRDLARIQAVQHETAAQEARAKELERQIAETEAKTKAIERALAAEDRVADRAIAPGLMHVPLPAESTLQPNEHQAELELRKLLLLFGMKQASAAANRVAPDVVPESLQAQALAGASTGIKWFWEMRQGIIQRADRISAGLQHQVRTQVRDSIAEWSAEVPKPSAGEIARRLHTQVHAGSSDERLFVFSPERAAIIAQTELAQAENTGIFEGYQAAGIQEVEWLAQSDGRSGARHHEKLNRVRRGIHETWTDGLGNELRYPGDPSAPIASTINCRCTTRAIISSATGRRAA